MRKLFADFLRFVLVLIFSIGVRANLLNYTEEAVQSTYQNVNPSSFYPLLFNNQFVKIPIGPVGDVASVRYVPYYWNPDYNRLPLKAFETTCTSLSGKHGVCAPGRACSVFGGRLDGLCRHHGHVCCVNTITACNVTSTINNTYWQTPADWNPNRSPVCSLKIKLDSKYIGQQKPICQVRLDFLSFKISQPDKETVCATDSFQIENSINPVPTICGDNNDQHMYLHVPNSAHNPSQLKLNFSFGAAGVASSRNWNIKISLLPCGSSYLAPSDCLQYFTSTSGTVRSFNWIDTAETATRQLANQDYKICFRNELVKPPIQILSSNPGEIVQEKKASSICFSVCPNTNRPFSVSRANFSPYGGAGTGVPVQQSQLMLFNCNNDFLAISRGYDPNKPASPINTQDRYCGERFNTIVASLTHSKVCTSVRPFSITYRTNNDETKTLTADSVNRGNAGFCLSFDQQSN